MIFLSEKKLLKNILLKIIIVTFLIVIQQCYKVHQALILFNAVHCHLNFNLIIRRSIANDRVYLFIVAILCFVVKVNDKRTNWKFLLILF